MECKDDISQGLVAAVRRGAVLEVTLQRERKRNAMDGPLARAASAALRAGQVDPEVRAIVLRGAGGTLSSGADLDDAEAFAASGRDYGADPRAVLVRVLRDSPVPVVAVVDGYAIGLGMALAGAATFAVATTRSAFAMPEASMGFFPFGVVPHLLGRTPAHVVLEWGLTGRRVDGAEAHAHGLVTHLVVPEVLGDAVERLLGSLVATPRSVLVAGLRWQARVREEASSVALLDWCEAALGEGG